MWGGFFLLVFLLIIVIIVLLLPPAVIMFILWSQSRKTPHSIIRSHPYLGWLHYLQHVIDDGINTMNLTA